MYYTRQRNILRSLVHLSQTRYFYPNKKRETDAQVATDDLTKKALTTSPRLLSHYIIPWKRS